MARPLPPCLETRIYAEYIGHLAQWNYSLSYLHKWLCQSSHQDYPSRVTSLSYFDNTDKPSYELLEKRLLESLFTKSEDTSLQGRIILVEDPDQYIISTLGRNLDIDPLFFASHIHSPCQDLNEKTPKPAIVPSRLRQQHFVTICYHRTFVLKGASTSARKLTPQSNVHRKINVLSAGHRNVSEDTMGLVLAQQCCSILKTTLPGGRWLFLVISDSPINHSLCPWQDMQSYEQDGQMPLEPFLGGYEDFCDLPSFQKFQNNQSGPTRHSLLDDFIHYWSQEHPQGFDPKNPSLVALAYYPMRIVAGEWMNHLTLMRRTIQGYEYSLEDIDGRTTLRQDLDKLKADLNSLQSWRRWILSTNQQTRAVAHFIRTHAPEKEQDGWLAGLLEDCNCIAAEVKEYGNRLEGIFPVVTSTVQMLDSRRALAETARVTRLTYLAVVFVPLTWASGLFSMSEDMAPGKSLFWVYFVVAFPLALAVFLIAWLPSVALRNRWERFKDWFGLRGLSS